MSAKAKTNIDSILDTETAASEASIDDPAPTAGIRRRGGAKTEVYSVRLTPDQVEQINAIADRDGIPASALVRDWVVEGLRAEMEDEQTTAEEKFAEAVRLLTNPELKKSMARIVEIMDGATKGMDLKAISGLGSVGLKVPSAINRRSRNP